MPSLPTLGTEVDGRLISPRQSAVFLLHPDDGADEPASYMPEGVRDKNSPSGKAFILKEKRAQSPCLWGRFNCTHKGGAEAGRGKKETQRGEGFFRQEVPLRFRSFLPRLLDFYGLLFALIGPIKP